MWWIIFPIAAAALIVFIIFDQRKKIFKKRVKKQTVKKVEVKPEKKVEKKFNSKISLEKPEAVKREEAVIEDAGLSAENQQFEAPLRPRMNIQPISRPSISDDDFEEFRRKHSYTNFLTNKSILQQIKELSPEMKAIIFGNVLDRKDEE